MVAGHFVKLSDDRDYKPLLAGPQGSDMKPFSQRKGIKPVKTIAQIDSMDKDLRTGLWNFLSIFYWSRLERTPLGPCYLSHNRAMHDLCQSLWHNYFKHSLDSLSDRWDETRGEIRTYFFSCKWYEVYDFIEFVANDYRPTETNSAFMIRCNDVLEREVSAYRFVGGTITQITSEQEITEVEEALQTPLTPVTDHLKTALGLLSNKTSPDYRNSIKESISSVEAICKLIARRSNATLPQALKRIEDDVQLHPALKKAFNILYGYTSDAEGIRHALLEQSTLGYEDAKFMLVSCSAFVNYLTTKASKARIKL